METPQGEPAERQPMQAASPLTITIPLTLPSALYRQMLAMTYYDSRNTSLDVGAKVIECMEAEIKALREAGDEPEQYLAEFERELDAGQYPDAYPPRLIASETQARTYGVSRGVLEAATSYAREHGRTLEEFIADALGMIASEEAESKQKEEA